MTEPKIVAYLAHPVGPDRTPAEVAARRDNIANTLAWMRWLVENTRWAILVPWLPYVQILDETTHRDRGIADDLAFLERCDVIVLTGGRISPGMAAELAHAHAHGIPVVDLTSWGFRPLEGDPGAAAALALRTRRAITDRPRRVWLPPITVDNLDELKGNRAILRANEADHDVVSAIIAAAEVTP